MAAKKTATARQTTGSKRRKKAARVAREILAMLADDPEGMKIVMSALRLLAHRRR